MDNRRRTAWVDWRNAKQRCGYRSDLKLPPSMTRSTGGNLVCRDSTKELCERNMATALLSSSSIASVLMLAVAARLHCLAAAANSPRSAKPNGEGCRNSRRNTS
jgi:hypothetical protein